MSNYEEILSRSWDDLPEDKVLPEGSWILRGRNATFQKSEGKGGDRFLFIYQVQEAMDDVDEKALSSLGNYDVKDKQVFFTMFVQRPNDWKALRAHLAKHGIDVTGNIQQSLQAFPGTDVVAYLGTKTFTTKGGDVVTDNDPTQFSALS